ncbi:hypothetical protein OIU35_04380 [Boseaceae bacterium BT-24-1]|nr:hypothetical protein [Boseaceae bacterium BT-24-1]
MPGRPLTDVERKSWRLRLEKPMPPDAMIRLVEELRDILQGRMLVQAGLAFIRDAWTAGKFAQARGADAVRLWPGDRPDCELTFDGKRELFEIVEADQPGRQRSAEYRTLVQRAERGEPTTVEEDPVEDWIARAANGPKMIMDAAMKKAAKGYDPNISLLIYLNLGEYGIRRREIEEAMQPSTTSAKDSFYEVWVLWQGAAYSLWRVGEPLPLERHPKRETAVDSSISDAAIWKSALEAE